MISFLKNYFQERMMTNHEQHFRTFEEDFKEKSQSNIIGVFHVA